MGGLSEQEVRCLQRYCALLSERLGDRLVEVRMFGSAARGDMWPSHAPQHSDIDLLVITRGAVEEAQAEALVNATYPLYLECGRQLSPQFFAQDGSATRRTPGHASSSRRSRATRGSSGPRAAVRRRRRRGTRARRG